MSSKKRGLSELSQAPATITPRRYAPSTPHAIRALQERSSAKRSARSARSTLKRANFGGGSSHPNKFEPLRPDGSIRNILKQFAKITAPLTKKRISTPINVGTRGDQNKENARPGRGGHDDIDDADEDDTTDFKKPNFTFNLQQTIEEDDSEIPVAPTPSALLDDSELDDDDLEQPTLTFQNIDQGMREGRAMSEKIDRRKSRVSFLGPEDDGENGHDRDDDPTILTERGRRAISEEATGRLSRYSFGSIRMSEFGSELEIRRNSDRQEKLAELENEDDYVAFAPSDLSGIGDYSMDDELPHSPTVNLGEISMYSAGLGDQTFNLPMPDDEEDAVLVSAGQHHQAQTVGIGRADSTPAARQNSDMANPELQTIPDMDSSRQQTTLEAAATKSHRSRRQTVKMTKHGTTVPSLPSSFVKRVATEVQTSQGKRKPKFARDHMKALEQATEWFFEQLGEDMAAYSSHGRRKKRVNVDDVLLLMRRQRVLSGNGDLRRSAKEWLPAEVLNELDLPDLL